MIKFRDFGWYDFNFEKPLRLFDNFSRTIEAFFKVRIFDFSTIKCNFYILNIFLLVYIFGEYSHFEKRFDEVVEELLRNLKVFSKLKFFYKPPNLVTGKAFFCS